MTDIHEAGHAVAAAVLGLPLEYVTIRPDADAAGRTVVRPPAGLSSRLGPHPVLDHGLHGRDRALVEAHLVVALAGDVADRLLLPPPADTHRPAPVAVVTEWADPDREVRLASTLSAVGTTDHREASDRDLAVFRALELLGDPLEAGLYVSWCEAVAGRLVRAYGPAILAVARALRDRGTLSGGAVAGIVEAATAAASVEVRPNG